MQARPGQATAEALVGLVSHMFGEAVTLLGLTSRRGLECLPLIDQGPIHCVVVPHPGKLPRISASSPVARGELRDSGAETLFTARYEC